MGKSYHTKHDVQKRRADFELKVKDLMEKNAMCKTAASLSVNHQAPYLSKKYEFSRHPGGTKAKGLRKVLREKCAVLSSRDRYGWAEEQSSRLRRFRRNVHKAARQEARAAMTVSLEEE